MKTDTIFYRLFQSFPNIFFELIDLPPETAQDYQFSSVEVKQLSFRIDGVFLPDISNIPIYFVEVQFQLDPQIYSRFFSEIFLYLNKTQLINDWQGVVIYPSRNTEPRDIRRYRELMNPERVTRIYLDELETQSEVSMGIATLRLITTDATQAINTGRKLVKQVREQIADDRQRAELLQLIETILIYKLPRMKRQEIEAMFSLSDLKQTEVYREALEEGRQEGKREAKREMIPQLLSLGLNLEQISIAIDLPLEEVIQMTHTLENY